MSPAFITAAKKISVTAPSIRFGVIDCAGRLPSNRTVLERFKLPPVNYSAVPTGFLFANSERPVQVSLALPLIMYTRQESWPSFRFIERSVSRSKDKDSFKVDARASGSIQVRDGSKEACAVGREVQVLPSDAPTTDLARSKTRSKPPCPALPCAARNALSLSRALRHVCAASDSTLAQLAIVPRRRAGRSMAAVCAQPAAA